MTYAAIAAAGIGAAGSIGGGLIGKSGSKKGGKQQRLGAIYASQHLQEEAKKTASQLQTGYEAALGEIEPYAQGGGAGFAQLMHGLGIVDLGTGKGVNDVDYGSLINRFSEDKFKTDPGYQFALSEGQKGIERQFSKKGLSKSGAVMKALTRFNQGTANQQYQNAWARYGLEQDRQGNALFKLGGTGANIAGGKADLHRGHSQDQANLTQQTALNHANLVQAFFGSKANEASTRADYAGQTVGSLANIGQGLLGSLGGGFSGFGGLSQTGAASTPFTGPSFDNSIFTGATPKF